MSEGRTRTSLRGQLDRTARLYLRIRQEGEHDEETAWRWAVMLVRAIDHVYAEEMAAELFAAETLADIFALPTTADREAVGTERGLL